MLHSLLRYMDGDAFNPTVAVDEAAIRALMR
jgi:hypothetical protein